MKLVTLIPAKPFQESKTRLSGTFSADQRKILSQNLLRRSILLAQNFGPVVVVSRSAAVRRLAKNVGAWSLPEHQPDLNAAVWQGLQWISAQGGQMALVLPLDLPCLSTTALQDFIQQVDHQPGPFVAISPCRKEEGTNALLLHPPLVLQPKFGPNSFILHQQAAQAAQIPLIIHHSKALAWDLDTPNDWQALLTQNLFTPEFLLKKDVYYGQSSSTLE